MKSEIYMQNARDNAEDTYSLKQNLFYAMNDSEVSAGDLLKLQSVTIQLLDKQYTTEQMGEFAIELARRYTFFSGTAEITTVGDLIVNYTEDVDVVDDYTESLYIAYCGTKLTDAGLEKYRPLMDLKAKKVDDYTYVIECPNGRVLRMLKDMFEGMAGYCSEEEYDKYFYDV